MPGNLNKPVRVIISKAFIYFDVLEVKELIKYCSKGNSVAQGELFNTYYNSMYHLAMRILANHHDTEDVLSESFSRIFKHIHEFEYQGEGSLNRWIKTIIIRESIRFLNKKKKLFFYDEVMQFDEDRVEPVYDGSMLDKEEIYGIIESMPDGYRTVFNLFAIEGYSHKEIAEMLEITENTSKSQLRKARIYIIERMKKFRKYG
jgi:RNA polymerase sigma-70 factor (ECF subfamily)